MDITLHKENFPHGSSSRKMYEDADIEIYFGSGNRTINNHIKIASVEFKKLDLKIHDTEELREFLQDNKDQGKILKFVFDRLDGEQIKNFLSQMIENNYKNGVSDGKHQKMDEIKKALGIEESMSWLDGVRY